MDIVDKILSLKELGYSKEEIDRLMSPPEIETVVIKQDEEKPEETPKEEDQKEEVKQSDETNNRLSSIEETLKSIQANNIKWSNMPTVKEEKTELEIVNEILGGINTNGNE